MFILWYIWKSEHVAIKEGTRPVFRMRYPFDVNVAMVIISQMLSQVVLPFEAISTAIPLAELAGKSWRGFQMDHFVSSEIRQPCEGLGANIARATNGRMTLCGRMARKMTRSQK